MSIAADAAKMINTNILIGIIVGVFLVGIGGAYAFFVNAESQPMGSMMGSTSNMMKGNNMMSGMMSQIPQDVIVKVTSGQITKVGKETTITLLVLNKDTKKPVSDAQVIIGIERGASMTTMNMVGGMFEAEEKGSGKYLVKFTPDSKGYYTMHTHVILDGKSMHSMMENHLDIGIIVK
jgi:hypothetical protein